MNDLSAAMKRVDDDRAGAIGGAGEPFAGLVAKFVPPDRPASPSVVVEEEATRAEQDVAAIAKARNDRHVYLRALARTVVSLAAECGEQDPRYHRPADIITADNIGEQLIAVMEAKAVILPPAFRQSSEQRDADAAEAVRKALLGSAA